MNTTQLECFMEVANCLNFSRAAEHLSITQPAVSHQINTLESELGVKLFQRTSKSVRLTQEGFLFTQYAGEILKMSILSKARVKEFQSQTLSRLVIGCRSTTELWFLRPALSHLCRTQPDILPVLRLIPFDALENLLREGTIHLMFSFRETAPPKSRYLELFRCPVMCACSREHPLASCGAVTLEQLQGAGRIAACRPPPARRCSSRSRARPWATAAPTRSFSATSRSASSRWWRPATPSPWSPAFRAPTTPGCATSP